MIDHGLAYACSEQDITITICSNHPHMIMLSLSPPERVSLDHGLASVLSRTLQCHNNISVYCLR